MKGLKDNRHILDAIAQELLENSRITGLVRHFFSLLWKKTRKWLKCRK